MKASKLGNYSLTHFLRFWSRPHLGGGPGTSV